MNESKISNTKFNRQNWIRKIVKNFFCIHLLYAYDGKKNTPPLILYILVAHTIFSIHSTKNRRRNIYYSAEAKWEERARIIRNPDYLCICLLQTYGKLYTYDGLAFYKLRVYVYAISNHLIQIFMQNYSGLCGEIQKFREDCVLSFNRMFPNK